MENKGIEIRLAWENKYLGENAFDEQCYVVGEVYEMMLEKYSSGRVAVRSIRAMEPLYPKEFSFDSGKVTISAQVMSAYYGWLTVEEAEQYAKNVQFAVEAAKAIEKFVAELKNGNKEEE